MKISIFIRPLSINAAFQGRRFKTRECKSYEEELLYLLPNAEEKIKGKVSINYKFYLVNCSRTDGDNLLKLLNDVLVRRGYFEDDRKIYRFSVEKIPCDKNRIEIEIKKMKEGIGNMVTKKSKTALKSRLKASMPQTLANHL